MRTRRAASAFALVSTMGLVAGMATVAPANAVDPAPSGIKVIASGLDLPFGLQAGAGGFVVAENIGDVTGVNRAGQQRAFISNAAGVSGVAAGRGKLFAVTGGPNEEGEPPAGDYPPSSVLRSDFHGHTKPIADLGQWEIDHNPDGQAQFDENGVPYDALSNPFSVNYSKFGLLVADGGGNDVLKVNPRTGAISTFFVPKTVTDVPVCLEPTSQANPGTVGCDPVPTGVAVRGNSVYVSTLGAEAPGAARVYKLNGRTGKVTHVWKGFTALTGITVSPDRTLYLSEVLYGAPPEEGAAQANGIAADDEGPPQIGRITRVHRGKVAYADVSMPIGLDYFHGHLYSTAGSLTGPGAGQIVEVKRKAFHP